jgi:NDP-sugar pyrophosphorylase family protein
MSRKPILGQYPGVSPLGVDREVLRALKQGAILVRIMNDIRILSEEGYGLGFVPQAFLAPGEDEYRIRDVQLVEQLGRSPSSFRRLSPHEIETLVKNGNSCRDWDLMRVSDPFAPELVKNCEFAGLVRLGKLERVVLEHHETQVPAGIVNSRIIACDIGDNCSIQDSAYLAHYIVGDGCILLANGEIHVSNHAKFGNGIVMEGEGEELRVELDLMNEAGGRSVPPFESMICADAYLWARNRDDMDLMARFRSMTDTMFDRRRGRYGTIGRHSVLKSNRVIKDVAVGECAYVKGSNKLKNLTILSSEAERSQIGEGVELVNGIVGYGCHVFYGCKAVRFVMGANSALKYGARLIHSVLGDNSTVSCCEMLNNLIFPAHEQHHNTSFLVASLLKGQSNLAAGATVGSNHNSRSNDGEIEAGRGFWPGLCTSVKHSSRFASYCLLAKGDYRYELDIRFPFCLVDDDRHRERLVLSPAFWWTHNLFALMRNESKFHSRDKRITKTQAIEFSPFAPDTAEEIIAAVALLEQWTGAALARIEGRDPKKAGAAELRAAGAAMLDAEEDLSDIEVLGEGVERSQRPAVVLKPRRARAAYREMLIWYGARTVLDFLGAQQNPLVSLRGLVGARETSWENLGGQLVPASKLAALFEAVRAGRLRDWDAMHAEYARLASEYPEDKARHALACLALLYPGRAVAETLRAALAELALLSRKVEAAVLEGRRKDYENPFRRATYRSEAEMRAVVGLPEDNAFVRRTALDMEELRGRIVAFAGKLA